MCSAIQIPNQAPLTQLLASTHHTSHKNTTLEFHVRHAIPIPHRGTLALNIHSAALARRTSTLFFFPPLCTSVCGAVCVGWLRFFNSKFAGQDENHNSSLSASASRMCTHKVLIFLSNRSGYLFLHDFKKKSFFFTIAAERISVLFRARVVGAVMMVPFLLRVLFMAEEDNFVSFMMFGPRELKKANRFSICIRSFLACLSFVAGVYVGRRHFLKCPAAVPCSTPVTCAYLLA